MLPQYRQQNLMAARLGALAAALADASTAATAQVVVQGVANSSLANASVASTGQVLVHGITSVTLDAANDNATGTVAIHGAAAVTLGDATSTATGAVSVHGALGVTLTDATLVAGNAVGPTGTLNVILGDAGVSSVATTFTLPGRPPFRALSGKTSSAQSLVVFAPVATALTSTGKPATSLVRGGVTSASLLRTGPRVKLPVQDALPYISTHVTIPITLTYQGNPFTPTSLTLTVASPGGTRSVYTLVSSEMQNPATGSYQVEIVPTETGAWNYAWHAVKADGREYYDEDKIVVMPRKY